MAIEVPAGIYTCKLLANEGDHTPALEIVEHEEWDAQRKEMVGPFGGAQLRFAARAFERDATSGEYVERGRIIVDRFGYSLVNPDTIKGQPARNAGEPLLWKIELLAEAFGVRPEEVFDLAALPADRLFGTWFDVEVTSRTSPDGSREYKSVNRIGPVGKLFARGSGGTSMIGGNAGAKSPRFSRYASIVRATSTTSAAAPAPTITPPTIVPNTPARPPQREEMPPPDEAPTAEVWNDAKLWQAWLEKHGDDTEAYFKALDAAAGRQVEPSTLSPNECEALAHKMGLKDLPF